MTRIWNQSSKPLTKPFGCKQQSQNATQPCGKTSNCFSLLFWLPTWLRGDSALCLGSSPKKEHLKKLFENPPEITDKPTERLLVTPNVTHPFGCPEYNNFLKPILFMTCNSSCGFQQGYHTFLYSHKKYNQGSGRKRTNEQYGLRSAPSARRVVLWHFFVQLFMHFVDYRWEGIFHEISTKLLGMPTHHDWSSLTASFCWPLSTQECQLILLVPSVVRSQLPLCVSLFQLPLSGFLCQLPLRLLLDLPFLPHFRSCQRSLFGFMPKRTKVSSA